MGSSPSTCHSSYSGWPGNLAQRSQATQNILMGIQCSPAVASMMWDRPPETGWGECPLPHARVHASPHWFCRSLWNIPCSITSPYSKIYSSGFAGCGALNGWNQTLLNFNQKADAIESLSSSVLDLRTLVKSNAVATLGSRVLSFRKLSQYSDWMPLVMYGLYSLGCS